jgi:hypothetical protein
MDKYSYPLLYPLLQFHPPNQHTTLINQPEWQRHGPPYKTADIKNALTIERQRMLRLNKSGDQSLITEQPW